jgi:hypothetical protein
VRTFEQVADHTKEAKIAAPCKPEPTSQQNSLHRAEHHGARICTSSVRHIFVSRFVHISSLDNAAAFASRVACIGLSYVLSFP